MIVHPLFDVWEEMYQWLEMANPNINHPFVLNKKAEETKKN